MKRIHPLLWILLLALGVRLIGITTRPIWYDEAFSIIFAAKGPAAMLYGTLTPTGAGTADIHPITYYCMLWAWMLVFGKSLLAIRALSILIGLASVALIYRIGQTLFTPQTAAAGAIIMALAPFQVHYTQEIRMYALLTLALLAATYSLSQARQIQQRRWWLAFVLACALAQYAHNLAAFYLVPLALTPFFTKDWKTVRGVFISGISAILLYLPWGIHLPAQFAKIQATYWTERPDTSRIFTTLLTFVTNLPLRASFLLPGLGITLTILAFASWQTYRAMGTRTPGWQRGIWLLYLAAFPPLLLFLFSQWRPVYIERALLPSGAVFCLWLAWAFFETGMPKIMRNAALGFLIIAAAQGLFEHNTYIGFPYAPYQALGTALSEKYQRGDVIIHSSKLTLLPMEVYAPNLPQLFIADPIGSNVDTLAPATQQVLGVTSAPDVKSAANQAQRVWLVIFKNSIAEYEDAGYENHPHVTWMQDHYRLVSTSEWGDLLVYQFEKPSAP